MASLPSAEISFPPAALRPPPEQSAPNPVAADSALAALDDLLTHLSSDRLDRSDYRQLAHSAARRLLRLAEKTLVESEAPRVAAANDYDTYFLVNRDSPDQHWVHDFAKTMGDLLFDSAHAHLDRALLVGLVTSIGDELRRVQCVEPDRDVPDAEDLGDAPGPLSPIEIWRRGHHAYGFLNRCAADELRLAVESGQAGNLDEAAVHTGLAASHIEGFTAAMVLAGDFGREVYRETVRPSMAPPNTGEELTGGMNVEHQLLREQIDVYLTNFGQTDIELYRQCPELAEARTRMLLRDLRDIELHVEVAWKAVDDLRALHHGADAPVNAVALLRGMAFRRAKRYSAYTELPTIEEV